ncbi:MAG: Do family serine endopeptidase [Chthoniobacteraceae bacterium]|jgi:serine protease Do
MNSPILWWTASRSIRLTRIKPAILSRLAAALLTSAVALPLVPLPVQAQLQSSGASKDLNSPAQVQVDNSPLNRNTGAITSFAPIVDKVGPSVVTITARGVKDDGDQPQDNPILRHFFGIPDDQGGGQGDDSAEALGSGVIVSSDGLILTNNHVAEAGDKITVRMGDHGPEYKARVVGNDPTSDLALLKIDAKNLPVITFADSDQVKVGDIVLAVGNPFALTNTVTMGIVSALGRGGMGITDYGNFIQTDASINPGNSGGALVDTEGRLIGVNTAIFSRSGGNQGIGFAVPSNLVRNVMDSLLKNGKVTRGFLGVGPQDLDADLIESLHAPADQQGALVKEVIQGGAADQAGLQDGDIITSVNGKPIADSQSLKLTIGGMNPGDRAQIAYLRDGQPRTVEAILGQEPGGDDVAQAAPQQGPSRELGGGGDLAQATPPPAAPPQGVSNVLDGIAVGDLDTSARSDLKIPGDVKGVVITDVSGDSVGYDAGLRKGDVILDMNRKPLTSADQAIAESNKIAKTEHVLLHVWSQDSGSQYLVLKPKDS